MLLPVYILLSKFAKFARCPIVICIVFFCANYAKASDHKDDAVTIAARVTEINHKKIYYLIERVHYRLKPGDTLSTIIYNRGAAGRKPFYLYSVSGWLKINTKLNPDIRNWNRVMPGTTLLIEYPRIVVKAEYERYLVAAVTIPMTPKVLGETTPMRSEAPMPPPGQPIAEAPVPPPEQPIAEAPMPPPAMSRTEVPEKSKSTLSIRAPFLKTTEAAWKKTTELTAGGYAGIRYGHSLSLDSSNPLLAEMRFFGLLAEIRQGFLSGFRFFLDGSADISAEVDGQPLSLRWQRMLVAYAFEFHAPSVVDFIHVIPKIGRYTLDGLLPLGRRADASMIIHHFSVKKALSLGIEGDAELVSKDFTLRLWGASDFSGIGIKAVESVSSERMGIDLFLKGPRFKFFEAPLNIAYLIFMSNEVIKVKGRDIEVGDFTVLYQVPYAGIGLTSQW